MRRATFWVSVLCLMIYGLSLAGLSANAEPSRSAGLQPRIVPTKPAHTILRPSDSRTRLHLKFREGSAVRLRRGAFATLRSDDLSGVDGVLSRNPPIRIDRLFSQPEAVLASEKARIERKSGRAQADLNLWYRVVLPAGADIAGVIDALNARDIVEVAYPEPLPAPLPTTNNYTILQRYRGPALNGIDAEYANLLPGGKGDKVKIIDIEYSWNTNHEDLSKARAAGAFIQNGTPNDPFNSTDHGTAVLGELVADENSFGVTGLAPHAELHMVNASTTGGYALANAINLAHINMTAGDVMLIEQQATGPSPGCGTAAAGFVPVEYVDAFYDAIVSATSDGIYVVEPAGNGGQNLDVAPCGPTFPKGKASSKAFIVGSAHAPKCGFEPPRSRLLSSTFGARVNLQGFGECVTTAGYGSLQGSAGSNDAYTSAFSGTSSASPIIAATLAITSSIVEQGGGSPIPAGFLLAGLLNGSNQQDTTSPGALSGHIGPLPNLSAAFQNGAPPNDNFASARELVGFDTSAGGANGVATAEAGEPNHAGVGAGKTVWFTWSPKTEGNLVIDTRNSQFDTVLAVYVGTSVNALNLIASNNDEATGVTSSRVTFPFTAQPNFLTLRIAVDTRSGTTLHPEAYVLNAVIRPFNDDFAHAKPQGIPYALTTLSAQTNVGATIETGEPAHTGQPGGASLWWFWTAPSTPARVELDTAGSTGLFSRPLDTTLAVYTGSAVNALSAVASNDDDGILDTSKLAFVSIPNTVYHFAVDGYGGSTGTVILHGALRPVNDLFSSAQNLTGRAVVVPGSNIGGTKETGEPNHAGFAGGASVWYSWTAPASGTVSIATTDTTQNIDTLLGVYTGFFVNQLTLVASNDNVSGTRVTSTVTFNATQGTQYKIAVDGKNFAAGAFTLSVGFRTPVEVSDSPPATKEFLPNKPTVEQGTAVRWDFFGPGQHAPADTMALGAGATPLYASGPRSVDMTYTVVFTSAGIYTYACALHPDQTGSVKVPLKASATTGTVNQAITITWSSISIQGYVFDVQVRYKPAGGTFGAWTDWKPDQLSPSGTFLASQLNGAGIYQLRARLQNQASGNVSNYSPKLKLTIT